MIKYVKPSIEGALKDYPRTGFVRADVVEKLEKENEYLSKNTERILKEIHENEKSVLSQINTLAENDMRLSLMISDIYEKVRNNKN